MVSILKKVWLFYYEGFKGMTLGKTLWIIVLIKLFVIFFILKLFFFKNDLNRFNTDKQKSDHVIENLTQKNNLNL